MTTKVKFNLIIMSRKSLRNQVWSQLPFLCIFLLATLLLAACHSGSSTQTSTPQPTATSQATKPFNVPLMVVATLPSTPTNLPVKEIVFAPETYTHPEKLFSLKVPEGWIISENASSATFTSVWAESAIYVEVINTGYSINPESLNTLIDNREKNKASEYPIYIQIARQNIPTSNAVLVVKQISNLVNGRTLSSLYKQNGQAVLILDVLVEQNLITNYQSFLDTLINSVDINSLEVSRLPLFSIDRAPFYNNSYFAIMLPEYWGFERSSVDNSMVETFVSPDEKAIVQTIIYDDGQPVSKTIAGELVLTLLRENYTKKITVQADDVLVDGRELLVWKSTLDSYRGITTFEARGTALLILTVMWYDTPDQQYQNLLQAIIDSYIYTGLAE